MARKLRFSVAVNGKFFPAGTAETAELKETVTNPAAWEGEAKDDKSEAKSDDGGRRKSSRKS